MDKRLEDTFNDTFIKYSNGLETELFVLGELGLDNAGKELKSGYTLKNRLKLMKREYNLVPDNIVKPLAVSKDGNNEIYILERIDGSMLMDSLYKFRRDKELYNDVKEQLLNTVEKLHSNGYVHGDLVGGNNIMLTKEGQVKLIDSLYIPKNFTYKDIFIKLDNESVNSVIDMIKQKRYYI